MNQTPPSPPAPPRATPGDWGRLMAGAALLVIGILWTVSTELSAVRDHRQRHRLADQVRVVSPDRILDLENGQLVIMNGTTLPLTELSDPEFPARTAALHMRRVVEIYQWQEETSTGEPTYRTEWSRTPVDSGEFPSAYRNPPLSGPVPGPWTDTARTVALGSFQLSASLIREIRTFEPWIPDQMIPPVGWHARAPGYIRSETPDEPVPGDIRVRFEIVPPGEVTLLAALEDSNLVPWQDPVNGPVFRVEEGTVEPASLLPSVPPPPSLRLWSFRILALLTQAVGLFWLVTPLVDHLLHLAPGFRPPSGPAASLVTALGLSLLLASLTWITRIPEFSAAILILFVLAGLGTVIQMRGLKRRAH